jgi:dolichyl-phosphate beta-glucosyltransferase
VYNNTTRRKGIVLKPTLTLLIPCFNEALRIERSLEQLKAWIDGNLDIPTKVVIVDDGSTDGSKSLIRNYPLDIKPIFLEKNLGKGGATAAGIHEVDTDFVLTMDLDLSTSLQGINTFYNEMVKTNVDLVVADRFHAQSQVTSSVSRKLSSKLFYTIVHRIINFETQDTQCGFKLYKTSVAKDLFSDLNFLGFSFDLEVLFHAESKYKIKQLPIQWVQKDGSRVRVIHDGLQMILDLLRLKMSKQGVRSED